jgi:acetyl esterase/lipase
MRTSLWIPLAAVLAASILVATSVGGQPKRAAARAKAPRPAADVSAVKPARAPDKVVVFKRTPQGDLKLHFYLPEGLKPEDKRPAILFWFGGGFTHGSPTQFYATAEYFASRGLVAACAEYRINSLHGTRIEKCFEDARSAIRWIKKHAGEFGIDPGKVIASGGSAGGTLSLAVALCTGPDAGDDDTSISTKPCAMVLFNPAQGEAVSSRIGEAAKDVPDLAQRISAINHPQKDQPPAIFFFGTADRLLPPSEQFCREALRMGNRCELWTAEGMSHGFFNRQPWHNATVRKADEFLVWLGYLRGEATIQANPQAVLKQALPETP